MDPANELRQYFLALLERHGIHLTRPRGTVLCLFHQEKTPSLSIDTERGLFHCFGCGVGGGVKDFARLVGEEWKFTNSEAVAPALYKERSRAAVIARWRVAEATARAILQRRKDEQEDVVWAEWCEANSEASQIADFLGFFFRRPDLAEEFSGIVVQLERDYGEVVFRRSVIEFRASGGGSNDGGGEQS